MHVNFIFRCKYTKIEDGYKGTGRVPTCGILSNGKFVWNVIEVKY